MTLRLFIQIGLYTLLYLGAIYTALPSIFGLIGVLGLAVIIIAILADLTDPEGTL